MSKKKRKKKSCPASGSGPVRTVIEQCPHRMTGAMDFPGVTVYPAVWESHLERFLICLLAFCEDVSMIKAQSIHLAYFFDGVMRQYTPDIEIVINNLKKYIEVKALAQLIREKSLEKYLAIAKSIQSQGEHLDFITNDQMPPMWTSNANLLLRYLKQECPTPVQEQVSKALESGACTIRDVLAELGPAVALVDIYTLIARRHLCFDWDECLTSNALVSLPDKPFKRMTYEAIRTAGRFADLLASMALGHRPPDERLLAAAGARRWPLSGPSPLGFVGGFSPAQLGHFERQVSHRARDAAGSAAPENDPANRANTQPTERK